MDKKVKSTMLRAMTRDGSARVLVLNSRAMINEMRANVTNSIKQVDLRALRDENELSTIIRRSIKNYIFKQRKKSGYLT